MCSGVHLSKVKFDQPINELLKQSNHLVRTDKQSGQLHDMTSKQKVPFLKQL